jgi:hypothetical protein
VIIGISGKKQAGKTTFAKMIMANEMIQKRFNVEIINMADSLKRTVLEYFVPSKWNLGIDDLADDAVKNRMCPCGKTIRQLLQTVGTDMFRSIDIEYAFQPYINSVNMSNDENTIILTPDIRFPNEVDLIHKMDGIIIRLLRNPFNDPHESEHALDELEERSRKLSFARFDFIIDNSNFTLEQLNEQVGKIFDYIMRDKNE